MLFCIENEDGEFYAGTQEGKAIWFRSRRPETRFDEALADAILRQLTHTGYQKIEKKPFEGKVRVSK
jgi:hypothetical protein